MPAVFVPDAKLDKSLHPASAAAVLSSMEQFAPEEWGLPPFADAGRAGGGCGGECGRALLN